MPSFIFLSIGQTTRIGRADYQEHFIKCLTLCRWAAGRADYQAREPHQTTKQQQKQQEQTTISRRQTTNKFYEAAARGRLPRRVRARGPYAVRHAHIKQEGFDISKGAAPSLSLSSVKQQLH